MPSYKVQYKNSSGALVDVPLTAESEPYTNSSPVPSAIGGIAKGTTFLNKPVTEVLDMLLYPYVAHSISASVSPDSGGVKELGTTCTINSVSVRITFGTLAITSIQIYSNLTGLIKQITTGLPSGAAGESTTFSTSFESKTISANETITIRVYDEKETVKSANIVYTFVSPYYYGVIDDVDITENLLTGLTKDVKTKGTKSYTYNMVKQKAVIAYPASYGALGKILDANSFDVTETFVSQTTTIGDVSYLVYVLSDPVTSTMTYAFSY